MDPTRVAICGDSAGANLAAGVVQELCDKTNTVKGICRPKLQVLFIQEKVEIWELSKLICELFHSFYVNVEETHKIKSLLKRMALQMSPYSKYDY